MGRILRLLLPVVLLGGLGAGAWWWTGLRPERVAMARVSEGPLASGFMATGRVRSTERARVGAKVAGRIVSLRVDQGHRVERGQLVAVLAGAVEEAEVEEARAEVAEAEARLAELRAGARPEEIRMAEERLRQAEVDAELAKKNRARARRLVEQGFIAAQQADEAETRAAIAAHEVLRAREALELLRQGARPETIRAAEMTLGAKRARLQRMEAARAELTIASPLAGTVVERYVEPGETMMAGQALFLIESTNPAHLEVRADVQEELIGRVKVGGRTLLVPDGGARALEGRVSQIAPGVDSTKATVEVRIRLIHLEGGRSLRPGTTVDVTVLTSESTRALVVPKAAVWSNGGRWWALRVRDGKAERVPVRTGIDADGLVQIVDGLAPGDWVVTAQPDQIPPGRPVAPLNSHP